MHIVNPLLLAGLLTVPVLASAKTTTDVFEMDLEQLLQLEVSVASGRADSIVDAPAIVSRYSRTDLERLGIRTLKDMLSLVPGVVRQETYIGGTAIGVRGISDGFNQKLLLLLDESPYWMTSHSDMPLLGIPFESIDRIEVIRGPASVMYGTNASAGIVRVITRKDQPSQATLAAGSHGLVNGSAYASQTLGAGRLDVSVEAQRDDGYQGEYSNMLPVPVGYPNAGQRNGVRDREVNLMSALARYSQEGVHLALQSYRSQTNGFAFASSVANASEYIYRGALAYADYVRQTQDTEIKLYSDFNNFYLELPTRNITGYGVDGAGRVLDPHGQYRWRTGLTANYKPDDQFNVLAGVEHEKRTHEDYVLQTAKSTLLLMSANDTSETSGYAQADYGWRQWRMLVGGRLTVIRNSEQQQQAFTPRLGLVYRFNDDSSLKALYSEGFNVPNALQTYVKTPILSGNRDLKPERVSSTEMAYTWARDNTLFVANAYYSRGQDFIGRRSLSTNSTQVIYYNVEQRFDRWGGELDFQLAGGSWQNFANLAYQHQGNRKINGDASAWFTPRYTAAAGSSYCWRRHCSGGVVRFVGERANVPSTTQLDLNYQFEQGPYQWFATARNVLDRSLQQPDVLNYVPYQQVDGGEGANFLVGMRYRLR